jgi:D-glycero-beta-D-manno-heptose-7-phosphate kinase
MTKAELDKLFDGMNDLHVVVIGDVMLDNYSWGHVDRISPEAPVPIVTLTHRESRLGGAANVALNCRALGAKVTLASVIGDDGEGVTLTKLANDAGINTELLMKSWRRPTTTKTRILSRNQQMMRVDDEVTDELYTEEEHPFIDMVLKYLQKMKPHAVIFEDYNKGVLKENVISRVAAHCREIGIITTVDPKKKNFLAYKHVTIFKPNLKEVREGLNLHLEQVSKEELDDVHGRLNAVMHQDITFITLSEKGVFFNNGFSSGIIPSHIRSIADVSGAGDTVIATATMVYALTRDVALMAELSNLAGGIVCEEVGVVSIKKDRLRAESEAILCK